MSLSATSKLIEESRKVVDASQENSVLNLILQIVTDIDNRMKSMDQKIEQRLDELKQSVLSLSSRVRTLESKTSDFEKKVAECESSCSGISNLFDRINGQVKTNTRNIIQQHHRIQKLEESPVVHPVIQPVIEGEEIKTIKAELLDLKCRSMKNNLIFTGLHRVPNEDTEKLLRCFLHHELGVNYKIEFGNVHRIRTNGDFRRAPIVARFLYHQDLEYVLSIANRLKGKHYGIREQFPPEIEQKRRQLYPIMRQAKRQNRQVALIRDKLYIDNQLYVPTNEETVIENAPEQQQQTPRRPSDNGPPSKRQRQGPSPQIPPRDSDSSGTS